VAKVVEHLPSKPEALSSNPSNIKILFARYTGVCLASQILRRLRQEDFLSTGVQASLGNIVKYFLF
jgi:hypothetical protein